MVIETAVKCLPVWSISAIYGLSLDQCKEKICETSSNAANYQPNGDCYIKRCDSNELNINSYSSAHVIMYMIPEYWSTRRKVNLFDNISYNTYTTLCPKEKCEFLG